MSRKDQNMSPYVLITTGQDHVVGKFIQIYDKRYAWTEEDLQGEGIVLDWDEVFGFGTNLIEAKVEDLDNFPRLLELANNVEWTI